MMRKILIRAELVLCGLVLFFSITLIVFDMVLPRFGIGIYYRINGDSMYPTIREGALLVGDRTPYEDLQVGDIIFFKKVVSTSARSTISIVKEGEEMEKKEEGTSDKKVSYHYFEHENVLHRIVKIDSDSIRTKGDNNDGDDFYPVTTENYKAKLIWWNNYLGWPFLIMYEKKLLLWLMGGAIILGLGLVLVKTKKPE